MVIPAEQQDKSDEELVLDTLKNEDFYGVLIERYQSKLTRYVRRISNFSDDDIEDVLQNVFIKAYRNLNDFDRDLKFSSWIYRITHNEVISQFRKRQARPQNVIAVEDEKVINRFSANIDLEKDIDNAFLSKNIVKALARVAPKYREILVLRFMEDKSYEEISNILKKPVSTVGTMLRRAKEKLKHQVAKANI